MIKLKENIVNDFHYSHAVIFIDFLELIFLLCFSFMLKYADWNIENRPKYS